MKISGLDKVTLLNYPGNVAATIFTKGCNFKCSFCHNSSLINNNDYDLIDEEDVFKYLEKRCNILDGVCISGGEPLVQKDIKRFIEKIRSLNLKVKLDTNGSNYILLKELIDDNLLDYVAMDIKGVFNKYSDIINTNTNLDNIKKSIKLIENSNIDYEFRTTLVHEFHNIDDILEICSMLDKKSTYYLQNFVNSEGVLNKTLHPFSNEELLKMKKEIDKYYKNVIFRDI